MVSWPAMKSVITSSRSCLSLMRRPLSSSWACSSIDSKSPRSSPLLRRAAMTALRMRSSRPMARSTRRFRGVGIQCGAVIRLAGPCDERAHQGFHGFARLGRVAADLGVEQRLGHDLQGQVHHVGLGVADLAVAPRLQHPLGVIDHEPAVRSDPLAVKRRLGQLALAAPELAFAGQEPLPERPLRLPQPIVLDELPILVDQHLLDQVGMVDEHDSPGAESGRNQVAILLSPARSSSPTGRGRTPSNCQRASAAADREEPAVALAR